MRIKTSLKSNFTTGLVIVAPLIVTLLILQFVMGWLGGALMPVVRGTRLETFTANNLVLAQILALVLFGFGVTLVGLLAQRSAGRQFLGRTGQIVDFLPVFRTVYGTVKGMASSVTNRSSDFESVVYVEYPREGVYRLGLKTGESPGDLEAIAGEDAYNVFFPGSPNPTQGMVNLIPESNLHESEMSIRAAIRFLMTTGMEDSGDVIELDDDELVVSEDSPDSPESPGSAD